MTHTTNARDALNSRELPCLRRRTWELPTRTDREALVSGGDSCAEGLLGDSGGGIGVPSRGGGCGSDDG
jgi:hypothetical protein